MKAVPEGRIAKELRNEVLLVLSESFRKGEISKHWQVSQTVQLDKANGKAGTKAVRLINLLCPMGKLFDVCERKSLEASIRLHMDFMKAGEESRQYWCKILLAGE